VRPEEALIEPAILGARELASPLGKLEHAIRRLPHRDLDGSGIGQEIALAKGVGEMLLPRVLGVARAEHGVDAPRCEHGVGVLAGPLAHDHHLDACDRRRYRCPEASPAGADDEDVGDPGPIRRRRVHEPSLFRVEMWIDLAAGFRPCPLFSLLPTPNDLGPDCPRR